MKKKFVQIWVEPEKVRELKLIQIENNIPTMSEAFTKVIEDSSLRKKKKNGIFPKM